MTKVTVHITKDVLEATMNCSELAGRNCAIAYAINELLPNSFVGSYLINVYQRFEDNIGCNELVRIPLPNEAIRFIANFDRNPPNIRAEMPELSFDIDVPDEALAGINIDEVLACCDTLQFAEVEG